MSASELGMVVLVLALLAGALGACLMLVLKLRQRLRALQAQDEALSRRCDALVERLDETEARTRMDHLSDLVQAGVQSGRLEPEVGQALQDYLQDLRAD